jgi:REP element-mobilizing transposase RayT
MQTVIPLEPGDYYHIYDRGVNRENIFLEELNYAYFLKLYLRHVTPIAKTYAYCLLGNHFHLLVKIRMRTDAVYPAASVAKTAMVPVSPRLASKAFNNFLTAYAKGMNKTYHRTGPLFQHHFGRIRVTSDRYYLALVRYIHRNPQQHGLVKNFRAWPFSSYQNLLSSEPTPLERAKVLDWFGGPRRMRALHAGGDGSILDKIIGTDAD